MAKHNSYTQQFKSIKEDVRLIYSKITRDTAKEAKRNLDRAAYSILEQYYASYTPHKYYSYTGKNGTEYYHKGYIRTYNLYRMFFRHPIKEHIDNGHMAAITVSPDTMYDNYNISQDVVFDLVWYKGFRGVPEKDIFPPQNSLTPVWEPMASVENMTYKNKSPHCLLSLFIGSWGDDFGKKTVTKIGNRYKSKSNKYTKFD